MLLIVVDVAGCELCVEKKLVVVVDIGGEQLLVVVVFVVVYPLTLTIRHRIDRYFRIIWVKVSCCVLQHWLVSSFFQLLVVSL